jgi:flagellar biosynthesis GTPase FlhF
MLEAKQRAQISAPVKTLAKQLSTTNKIFGEGARPWFSMTLLALILIVGAFAGYEYQRSNATDTPLATEDKSVETRWSPTEQDPEQAEARRTADDAAAEAARREQERTAAQQEEAQRNAEVARQEQERIAATGQAKKEDESRNNDEAEARRKELASQLITKIDAAKSIRELEAIRSGYPLQLGEIPDGTEDPVQQHFLAALRKLEQQRPPENLSRYSLRFWPKNSLPRAGYTVSTVTPYGKLTCTSTGRNSPRNCSLR